MSGKRLFVVSNRLPVQIISEDNEIKIKAASGGLVTAVNSYLRCQRGNYEEVIWAGVPGCSASIWTAAAAKLEQTDFSYLPVMLYKEQYDQYYNGFANSVLWPLFHYFPSFVEYSGDHFDAYMNANQHFHDTLSRQIRPGDVIWIHDYHLLPLAHMLRQSFPDCTIGFFLHIPFPSFELFRLMPRSWQEKLLKGLLGADLIGFHTIDYATHFLQTAQMVLGLDNDRHILRYNNRLVKVDVFPISIDYQLFNRSASRQDVVLQRRILKDKLSDQQIIFSVDRLDYTKGVQNRLMAYEQFLKLHPEYINKVVFILVIVPSRDNIPKYAERKRMIDEMIGRINSRIGSIHWQPVIYQYNPLAFDEMIALYTSCDMAMITPLRDGMNLVAKEFVASRKDLRGVLVLSEMAGAARELTEALIINPNDIEEMAGKIHKGLTMGIEEQKKRIESMQSRIEHYDVQTWAEDYMNALDNIKEKQVSFQIRFLDPSSRAEMLQSYMNAESRLLLLDYDGTLVPFANDPEAAVPGEGLKELLLSLGNIAGNDVYLISGRSSQWLSRHFSELPINLIAEHGARSKKKNGEWHTEVQTHSEWKSAIHQVMQMYVRRCPNSVIEEKDFSIVWHYRNCNTEQGKLRASELLIELNEHMHNRHLQVIQGNKIVEVRCSSINKGTAISKILNERRFDFVFAVGDDRTDEDMFHQLIKESDCYSIKVGSEASYARYNLQTPYMVINLLQQMIIMPARSTTSTMQGSEPTFF